jgi:alanyl-tRNA synthetase
MSTDKLYWDDPFASDFDAERAQRGSFGGRPSIVLERTLFYPEAGGQLADMGTLAIGGASVTIADVQIDDDGTIHHLVQGDTIPESLDGGARGRIDTARRRDHMAQHTAQHMLSRALVSVARAETVSARLGASACTIDTDKPGIADRDLLAAEDLVNAVVTSDVIVRALFPSPDELAKLPLRRPPKVDANIRVIEVEAFDFTPCGGTHCTRTGQIGVVRIAGVEKYKGGLRVTFHAGKRAIDDARTKERVLADLAKDFTCGVLDVPGAVVKLKGDLKSRTDALSAARGELVELVAERVLAAHPPDASGTTRIVVVRDKDDVGALRALAGRICARPDAVVLCASADPDSGDHLAVVVQRGSAASFDCGAWMKAAAAAHGGRGGGRPERAEGRLPRGATLALT